MDLKCKVSLIGDQRVGKTSLILRYIEGTFSSEYITTLGADFVEKEYTSSDLKELNENDKFTMVIWDLAGQSHFEEIANFYIQGSAGIIIVFDVNNKESFQNITRWKQIYDRICPKAEILLVGNKNDLENVLDEQEIKEMEARFKTKIQYVSAKNDYNVQNIFQFIASKILNHQKK